MNQNIKINLLLVVFAFLISYYITLIIQIVPEANYLGIVPIIATVSGIVFAFTTTANSFFSSRLFEHYSSLTDLKKDLIETHNTFLGERSSSREKELNEAVESILIQAGDVKEYPNPIGFRVLIMAFLIGSIGLTLPIFTIGTNGSAPFAPVDYYYCLTLSLFLLFAALVFQVAFWYREESWLYTVSSSRNKLKELLAILNCKDPKLQDELAKKFQESIIKNPAIKSRELLQNNL
jgi:hypothetical protein